MTTYNNERIMPQPNQSTSLTLRNESMTAGFSTVKKTSSVVSRDGRDVERQEGSTETKDRVHDDAPPEGGLQAWLVVLGA